MAQFRLEVQAIKRADGRSAVAAAAYRAATSLHDKRLEMTFDYTAKGGVAFCGIVAPETAPAAFGDRETLWNAAEAADKRADSRTAREVLISLPHELSDDQRHALVRAFVQDSLVARGMIADYAIHDPDAHGDKRNHHAHILITTRRVTPEGFALKGREWDNPDAVKALRLEWCEIQNQHLRQHLGPEAPQLTHHSLADQGEEREPTIHLGPSASGMERRGEASDRGDINRRVRERNQARKDGPVKLRDLEDRMAAGLERGPYPIGAVIREFETIHATMVAERDGWARDLVRLQRPAAPRASDIVREVLAESGAARALAKGRLLATERRVARGRAKRAGLVCWVRNPARMIWAAHAELNALARAKQAARLAEIRYAVRRDWLRGPEGRAFLAARLDPEKQAVEAARREGRILERKIKRADKRIEAVARTRTRLMVARGLGEETLVAPSQMGLGVGQAVREVDRRVVEAISRHPAAAQQKSLDKVLGLVSGKGLLPGRERSGPDR
ncbi:MobQ family relaxase [Caulobacter sp. Root343]|uniref:MobQ family relaxase n=1 Tax=Caulobacter sp. Root343 TaxID=1736520 RepID=UPI0006FE2F94|nr:MobQ family relaxase [Caulobacter sp. Root343]KQV64023.1 molybdopterin-guanine dinucleotide biosynthesis protein MobA [Caulobacter sp. Root343]